MLRVITAWTLMCFLSVNVASAQIGQRDRVIDKDGFITTPAAKVVKVRQTCLNDRCPDHDAIVFVHGIYGDDEAFKNRGFDWPLMLPDQVDGRTIDVYRIDYKTAMLAWLRSHVATMDEVSYSIFRAIYPERTDSTDRVLVPDRYRSVNFIAHSLGGNVVSAFLHTVKSELGHEQRARYGFVVTLATPVYGAEIAHVATIAKRVLRIQNDPLLESYEA